jgi:hypothetical protein
LFRSCADTKPVNRDLILDVCRDFAIGQPRQRRTGFRDAGPTCRGDRRSPAAFSGVSRPRQFSSLRTR